MADFRVKEKVTGKMTGILKAKEWKDMRSESSVKFNRQALTIEILGEYEIDLKTCRDPGELCDWIFQIAGKSWVSDELLGQFVRAFDSACERVFGAGVQALFSPFGTSQRVDWTGKAKNRGHISEAVSPVAVAWGLLNAPRAGCNQPDRRGETKQRVPLSGALGS